MLKIPWIELSGAGGIYPLRQAESGLLQVLLPEFRLSRRADGFLLDVYFDEETPTIRRREGKARIRKEMPGYPSGVPRLQSAIESVLFGSRQCFHHADAEFVFRYASGGTLPIIEADGVAYYCLFYRDVFPVGWNIANGASDSLAELLNPTLAIERELREELMFFTPGQTPPIDFELSWPGVRGMGPEQIHSRTLVESFLAGQRGIPTEFRCEPFSVRWDPSGPDGVQVRYGAARPSVQRCCYLSINAADYGIEVDRVAAMKLASGMVVMDGEITDNRPLNRPVGLFEVGKTEAGVRSKATEFLPDRLFHTASQVLPSPVSAHALAKDVIQERHLAYLLKAGLRNAFDIESWRHLEPKFDLCPVTRQIIRRYTASSRY